MTKKSAAKSGKSGLPDGRVAPGRGPAKGAPNAGRPPDEFRAACRAAFDRYGLLERAVQIALSANSESASLSAIEWIAANGWGKPPQNVTLGQDPDRPFDSPLDDIRRSLARLAASK